jgi:hypothetical protein
MTRDYLLFGVGGVVCAAGILLLSQSGFQRWTVALGMSCLIVLCVARPEAVVYLMLLSGLFFTPLYSLSFRLFGVLVLPSDLLALLALVLFLVGQGTVGRRAEGPGGASVAMDYRMAEIFCLVLVVASVLGAIRGHFWKSVLREAKLCLYYGLIPVFATFLATGRLKLRRMFVWLVVFSTVGAIYDIYCRVFDIYTTSAYSGGVEGAVAYAHTPSGAIVRDYGWVSTFHYQIFAFLCAMVFFLDYDRWRYKVLFLVLAAVNLTANLLTLTRGFVLAVIVGAVTMAFLEGARKRVTVRAALPRIVAVVLLVVGVVYAVVIVAPQAKWAFYRTLSVFKPEYAGPGDIEQAQFRVAAIGLGARTALVHPFGRGLGTDSPTGQETLRERQVLSLLYHNSLGYILYTFGLVGGVVILGTLGWSFLVVVRMFHGADDKDKTVLTMIASGLTALFATSFTSGNFLFTVGSVLPYVIILFGAVRYYRMKEISVVNAG